MEHSRTPKSKILILLLTIRHHSPPSLVNVMPAAKNKPTSGLSGDGVGGDTMIGGGDGCGVGCHGPIQCLIFMRYHAVKQADLTARNVTIVCSVHTARTALHPPNSSEIVAVPFGYASISLSLGGLVRREHCHPMLPD